MRFLLAACLLLLASHAEAGSCEFPQGSYVKVRLDGRVGMVINRWLNDTVTVRFAVNESVTSRYPNDPPRLYVSVDMACFELRATDGD